MYSFVGAVASRYVFMKTPNPKSNGITRYVAVKVLSCMDRRFFDSRNFPIIIGENEFKTIHNTKAVGLMRTITRLLYSTGKSVIIGGSFCILKVIL